MARPSQLAASELEQHLLDIPLWRMEGTSVVREIVASSFAAAIGAVTAIAIEAEKADHHPDILVYGWNKVRVTLSTHSEGGLTILDIRLAKQIDQLQFSNLQ
jgi:4a-hydroxytetrahydrobiopterin dehydratase